jgi:hypothetical protein
LEIVQDLIGLFRVAGIIVGFGGIFPGDLEQDI